MNWLQRNLPSRESWAWVIVTAASVLGFLAAHFDLVTAAFEVGPRVQARIELFSVITGLLAAKQSFSWMPTKNSQNQAKIQIAFEKDLARDMEQLDRHDRD